MFFRFIFDAGRHLQHPVMVADKGTFIVPSSFKYLSPALASVHLDILPAMSVVRSSTVLAVTTTRLTVGPDRQHYNHVFRSGRIRLVGGWVENERSRLGRVERMDSG
jgi:hypothetical protein